MKAVAHLVTASGQRLCRLPATAPAVGEVTSRVLPLPGAAVVRCKACDQRLRRDARPQDTRSQLRVGGWSAALLTSVGGLCASTFTDGSRWDAMSWHTPAVVGATAGLGLAIWRVGATQLAGPQEATAPARTVPRTAPARMSEG